MDSHKDMTMFEHIGELRKRLVISVVFFFIAVILSFFVAEPLIVFLQNADEAKELTMNAFRLTDPIKVYMQFAFIIAFVLTSPVILYQLWSFISPGLYEKERKVTLSYIPISVLLFIGGIAFSYFILFPFVIDFMTRISDRLNINQVIGINEYFQFLFQLTLPFGFLFQLPVVIMFLTRLGLVTPMFLSQVRKYAYFVLIVIAAFITPPELLSHLMVTVPLLLLYEVSIIISRFSYKKAQESMESYD
ncbi:twin-arginine translocase subunit TatC [Cytobacillus spongiae]|jgi:sec-independent protein translocase protein TatC|uniref:twin-arginine translocase subunit TatC n=1 Tax=Cytobacillus spongiae TaxID=2901381 RepID=UPI001F471049|nr:twin-arginine translocase subunit TatC [Cytobacillus spongiae]UII56233.1 twin-arginine translocase subunit TatC [Cytobacillus spongiae]